MNDSYAGQPGFLSAYESGAVERAAFIRKTYLHLAGAILAFVAIEAAILPLITEQMIQTMTGGMGWLVVLGLFMVVSWVADSWAQSATSLGMQYAGLALYVVAEAVIFAPMLYLANAYAPGAISSAAIATGALFAGLTATAFMTRTDFGFLKPMLTIGGFVALGVIVASILIGFNLGVLFSGIMIVFAGAAILYTTSNIQRRYGTGQYVAASLSLFAAVALLFWYVLRIFMSARSN